LNSKILLLIVCSFVFSSCGVKAPPKEYPETAIDSYVQSYTHTIEPIPQSPAEEKKAVEEKAEEKSTPK
jgi:hypothetical protein